MTPSYGFLSVVTLSLAVGSIAKTVVPVPPLNLALERIADTIGHVPALSRPSGPVAPPSFPFGSVTKTGPISPPGFPFGSSNPLGPVAPPSPSFAKTGPVSPPGFPFGSSNPLGPVAPPSPSFAKTGPVSPPGFPFGSTNPLGPVAPPSPSFGSAANTGPVSPPGFPFGSTNALGPVAPPSPSFGSAANTIGPITPLSVVNKVISPDGVQRSSVLANGIFPGPLIVGNKGNNFRINVMDQLTDLTMLRSTTIHWHGLFQENSNWADGPAFVNQCPIAPGNSFTYDFTVPDQAGTFWYHSHLSTQYCDGLRGPLVIYDPDDPNKHLYDVDDESTIITLADWYHTVAPEAGAFPAADSVLINGLGRYSGSPNSELAVVSVQHGKRYRMRLVSISCDPNFVFSIDGHDMTIIEVDGVNHEALHVDSIQIFVGQRYSFILEATQPIDNYWIRALPNIGPPANFNGGINSAILRYVGAPNAEPKSITVPTSVSPLDESKLHPLVSPAAPGNPYPGGVDVPIEITVDFNGTNFLLNNASYTSPSVPVLLQILSGAKTAQSLMSSGSMYSLPSHKTIEINFPVQVGAGAPHPIHLHGHTFSVVRGAGQTETNYVNPVRRDVVSIGTVGDNVTIRFTTDNPGPWFLHCHIDWHLEAGFAVVMAEDIPDTKNVESKAAAAAWDQLCPTYTALSSELICVGAGCT